MIVLYRGFYSKKNIQDLGKYSMIGAIPATLSLYRDILSISGKIENSRNYFLSGKVAILYIDHIIE